MSCKPESQFPTVNKWAIGFRQVGAIVEADIRKLRHDPSELFTRMTQPVIWLILFGQTMANVKGIPTSGLPYLDFIAPGILAQSILFIAIFYGISLIWERDMGVLHKILVTPAPRSLLLIGRSLAAGIRGLSQAVAIYLLAFFLGVDLRLEPLAIMGTIAMVLLAAAVFSTFSVIVAAIVKKRERFMGLGQVLTMPLFFASNALYPIEIMPRWIQVVSTLNPLTYQVDALRTLMIAGEVSHFGLTTDFFVTVTTYLFLIIIATKLYPKIIY